MYYAISQENSSNLNLNSSKNILETNEVPTNIKVKKATNNNLIEENTFKIGNVTFNKIIDDFKKFETKNNKEL